jgi:hypothetical protein
MGNVYLYVLHSDPQRKITCPFIRPSSSTHRSTTSNGWKNTSLDEYKKSHTPLSRVQLRCREGRKHVSQLLRQQKLPLETLRSYGRSTQIVHIVFHVLSIPSVELICDHPLKSRLRKSTSQVQEQCRDSARRLTNAAPQRFSSFCSKAWRDLSCM